MNTVVDHAVIDTSCAEDAKFLNDADFPWPPIKSVSGTSLDAEFTFNPLTGFHVDSYVSLFEVFFYPD